MAEYYVNLNMPMSMGANEKLLDVIDEVRENDTLIITMNSVNAAYSDVLTKTLENNNFDYSVKGSHSGDEYQIVAKKEK
ncbi:hypothetical protein [Caldisalinibacter kiritimatiensis]|uniref:Uncharacterized protein n=1 Tax=Caldisalinibacter kiritimatiensis TaxID=1304284 RepID=R1CEC5_9FIRM|nr:hypothetical protein [Caldisalinibacter kiritimatiensis]EOD00645.1 hypothetical protein L21TH_1315 [Caldisalinibacter kiritimatiensis]